MDMQRKSTRDWLNAALQTPFENVINEANITSRQKEIIRLKFCDGMLNYQIAARLNVSPETVRDEIKKAYNKINKVLLSL